MLMDSGASCLVVCKDYGSPDYLEPTAQVWLVNTDGTSHHDSKAIRHL